MIITGKAEEFKFNHFLSLEIVLIDTKYPKVRIEIFMTGTKIAACHQMSADCDDLAICSKRVLIFEKYEYLCNIIIILHEQYWNGRRTKIKSILYQMKLF